MARASLLAAEQRDVILQVMIAQHGAGGSGRRLGSGASFSRNFGPKPPGNIPQLPHHGTKAEQDGPGAGHDRTGEDQRIAEAEVQFDSKSDRQEACQ